ncbi:LON peptidase substrate-binding domain-containing protein [soil metagenome]
MDGGRIPLFPLAMVLFPGEPLPLHIFEFRFREMVNVCLEEKSAFGLILSQNSKLEDIGCTARIARVINKYDDGRLDILCVGIERFQVLEVHDDKPYLTVTIAPYPEQPLLKDEGNPRTREQVIAQHMRLLEMTGDKIRPSIYEGADLVSYVVARNSGLELEQKQALLEIPLEADRLAYLAEHLQKLIRHIQDTQKLRRIAQGDGHVDGFPHL